MIENVIDIKKEDLHALVSKMHHEGQRLITCTCAEEEDGSFMILYHFDKDLKMTHFRIKIAKDEELESISSIYWTALLIENEIKEHYGVKINNIAIDFGGRMVLAEGCPTSPMLKEKA